MLTYDSVPKEMWQVTRSKKKSELKSRGLVFAM